MSILTKELIEAFVKQTIDRISHINIEPMQDDSFSPEAFHNGIFSNMQNAINAAYTAQKIYVRDTSIAQRKKIIDAMRETSRTHNEELSKFAVEETGLGRWEDKIQKNNCVIDGTPGVEVLFTHAESGDTGLMIEEYTPYGVIGSITPTTNPVATLINNSISMLAGGNSVVFNVHPSTSNVSGKTISVLSKAIFEICGISGLLTMVSQPTMDTAQELMDSDKVRLLVGTGGMGLVRTLLSSGKKCIGAGSGNPPVVVDETADIDSAAKEIFKGASFDNNVLCIAEKSVFVVSSVADRFIAALKREGAYLLSNYETEKILSLTFIKDSSGYHPNKDWVGKNAGSMLAAIGSGANEDTKLIVFEADVDHPFVQVEQLMPVLPIVRCNDVNTAIEYAVKTEGGRRHTASIFSKNVDNMTNFARLVDTTIFVKNGSTLAGEGIGGEGSATMTIAGPTGEGMTDARSFCRRRRCTICDGAFKIY